MKFYTIITAVVVQTFAIYCNLVSWVCVWACVWACVCAVACVFVFLGWASYIKVRCTISDGAKL